MAVGLVLALVENETLVSLKVVMNKRITDDTAKGFVKVFTQSNKTLKKLDLTKTKVSKKSLKDLDKILEERDEKKIVAKLQAERQAKIQSMLKAASSEKAASASDDENEPEMDIMSGRSSLKSSKSGKSKKNKKGRGAKVSEASPPRRGARAGAGKNRAASGRQQFAKSVTAAQIDGAARRGHRERRGGRAKAEGEAETEGGVRNASTRPCSSRPRLPSRTLSTRESA